MPYAFFWLKMVRCECLRDNVIFYDFFLDKLECEIIIIKMNNNNNKMQHLDAKWNVRWWYYIWMRIMLIMKSRKN
jgi:hypothetical protein